ncbi:hypothetical protein LT493_31770 [Streptomyces tricolor]|nr:hypothetical protein [Streptomyces tricolor]
MVDRRRLHGLRSGAEGSIKEGVDGHRLAVTPLLDRGERPDLHAVTVSRAGRPAARAVFFE